MLFLLLYHKNLAQHTIPLAPSCWAPHVWCVTWEARRASRLDRALDRVDRAAPLAARTRHEADVPMSHSEHCDQVVGQRAVAYLEIRSGRARPPRARVG